MQISPSTYENWLKDVITKTRDQAMDKSLTSSDEPTSITADS